MCPGQPPETYVLTAVAVTVNAVGLFHSLPTCTYLQDSAPRAYRDTVHLPNSVMEDGARTYREGTLLIISSPWIESKNKVDKYSV